MEILDLLAVVIGVTLLKKILKKEQKNNKIKEAMNGGGQMLNIYDEPLVACGNENMSSGSWDNEGKCSELGGAVHQICVRKIAKNTPGFSQITGQPNWSDKRGEDNHCVCLGAWSLYNAKLNTENKDKNVLKCDAIPKNSLSKDYVSKFSEGWNKWNGLEFDNQILDGVDSLMKNCYKPDSKKSKNLKKNYCKFASEIKSLQDSKTYKSLCK